MSSSYPHTLSRHPTLTPSASRMLDSMPEALKVAGTFRAAVGAFPRRRGEATEDGESGETGKKRGGEGGSRRGRGTLGGRGMDQGQGLPDQAGLPGVAHPGSCPCALCATVAPPASWRSAGKRRVAGSPDWPAHGRRPWAALWEAFPQRSLHPHWGSVCKILNSGSQLRPHY